MPKGFKVFPLEDPIHIPSVFDEFITSPESFLKHQGDQKEHEPSQYPTKPPLYHQRIEGTLFLLIPLISLF